MVHIKMVKELFLLFYNTPISARYSIFCDSYNNVYLALSRRRLAKFPERVDENNLAGSVLNILADEGQKKIGWIFIGFNATSNIVSDL